MKEIFIEQTRNEMRSQKIPIILKNPAQRIPVGSQTNPMEWNGPIHLLSFVNRLLTVGPTKDEAHRRLIEQFELDATDARS